VLLEGLKGGADAAEDHFVTDGELFGYVLIRMHVETVLHQDPRTLPGFNADLAPGFVKGK
jgi:hypothetical protein